MLVNKDKLAIKIRTRVKQLQIVENCIEDLQIGRVES